MKIAKSIRRIGAILLLTFWTALLSHTTVQAQTEVPES